MFDVMLTQVIVAFNPFSAVWEGIKQILGWIMNIIYVFFENVFDISNIGLSIVFFTIVVYTLLIPLTIKQQKSMKLNSVVQPEIAAIQKKYKNKNDQASMMKQNEEMQAVYKKYGTSPTGGCLTSFIQLPIMLALYNVLYNIPKYVHGVREIYSNLVSKIMGTDYADIMAELAKSKDVKFNLEGLTDNQISEKIAEVLSRFSSADWNTLTEKLPKLKDIIASTQDSVDEINSFFGIMSIAESPSQAISQGFKNGQWLMVIIAVSIPILAGVFSWLSMKNTNTNTAAATSNEENPMMSSMKMMNTIMPIFSAFICYKLPIGIGIYWVVSSLYRFISQIIISKRMNKIDVNDIIKANVEKYNKKMEKRGLPTQNMKNIATVNTKNTQMDEKKQEDREKAIEKSTEYYKSNNTTAKPGSLKAKANMVSQYNERNKK